MILNGKVYFCAGEREVEAFLSNPVLYIDQSAPIPAQVSCALVGPEHSGSEDLARMVAEKMDLVYVDPESAVAWVRARGFSTLCQSKTFMDETKVTAQLSAYALATAVSERLRSCECQRRGYILHGFPSSAEHVSFMQVKGFPVPAQTFVLDTPLEVLVNRQLGAYAKLAEGKEELLSAIAELEAADEKEGNEGEGGDGEAEAAAAEGEDTEGDDEGANSLVKLREKASALDVAMSEVGFDYFVSQVRPFRAWLLHSCDSLVV